MVYSPPKLIFDQNFGGFSYLPPTSRHREARLNWDHLAEVTRPHKKGGFAQNDGKPSQTSNVRHHDSE